MTDANKAIARKLLRYGYIRAHEYTVWLRQQDGETIMSIRKDFPRETGNGRMYASSTLYDWVANVNKAIAVQKALFRLGRPRHMSGHTTASGSRTRRVGDPTLDGRTPTTESNWDVERLQAAGVLDRWSRKR